MELGGEKQLVTLKGPPRRLKTDYGMVETRETKHIQSTERKKLSTKNLLSRKTIFQNISVFSNESVLRIRWPKYWSFSFSISPFNEYSGLISFRIDGWISLQSKGLKSLLQYHSSKASVLRCSAFFIVQLSHPYMITGKTIALSGGPKMAEE